MYLRLSTLACAILKVVSASSDISLHTTSTHEEVSRELLTSCETYDSGIPSTTITMLWTNALSGDTEWLNKNNYNYKHWPGLSKFNKVIMAVNDVGTVHCDATYMTNNIYLEMRSGATLDVSANLNIDDQLIMKTNSVLTQTSTSTINVGKNLYLAALYSIADMSHLNIGLDLYMASNAQLNIVGDGTSITASSVTSTDSQIHGIINYVFGASGTGVFDLGGKLTIGSTTAKINIDASGYTSGTNSIPLIKYTSLAGAYNPANIVITGLSSGLEGTVESQSDGLYLLVTGGVSTPAPTKVPTPSPIVSPVVSTTEATTITTTVEPETSTSAR